MNMLIEELENLSTDPLAWIVVAIMAILSLIAMVQYMRCPLGRGIATITDEQTRAAQNNQNKIGPRFGLMMMGAMALAVTGLFMIADGVNTVLALILVIVGIVLIQTEPARLRIRDQTTQVLAYRDAPEQAQADARYRLRAGYRELAARNFALLAGVVAALLAF